MKVHSEKPEAYASTFVLVFVVMAFACLATAAAANRYSEVQGQRQCDALADLNGWSVGVSETGNYCVVKDLDQPRPLPYSFRLPHQPVPKGPLIDILGGANDISIDLQQHQLTSKTHTGIRLIDGGYFRNNGGKFPPYHSITVKNGRVRTVYQPAVYMVHAWNGNNKRFYHRQFPDGERSESGTLADYSGDVTQYGITGYVLENLTLQSDNVTIIMQGKNNVIRHCKIIGGNGTVNLYGPNMVFEDNDIILNATAPEKPGDEPAVALYLEDAADSVVRNNRIIIEGHVANAAAIVLKNSENVRLEGNNVKGALDLFKTLDQRSSVTVSGDTLQR